MQSDSQNCEYSPLMIEQRGKSEQSMLFYTDLYRTHPPQTISAAAVAVAQQVSSRYNSPSARQLYIPSPLGTYNGVQNCYFPQSSFAAAAAAATSILSNSINSSSNRPSTPQAGNNPYAFQPSDTFSPKSIQTHNEHADIMAKKQQYSIDYQSQQQQQQYQQHLAAGQSNQANLPMIPLNYTASQFSAAKDYSASSNRCGPTVPAANGFLQHFIYDEPSSNNNNNNNHNPNNSFLSNNGNQMASSSNRSQQYQDTMNHSYFQHHLPLQQQGAGEYSATTPYQSSLIFNPKVQSTGMSGHNYMITPQGNTPAPFGSSQQNYSFSSALNRTSIMQSYFYDSPRQQQQQQQQQQQPQQQYGQIYPNTPPVVGMNHSHSSATQMAGTVLPNNTTTTNGSSQLSNFINNSAQFTNQHMQQQSNSAQLTPLNLNEALSNSAIKQPIIFAECEEGSPFRVRNSPLHTSHQQFMQFQNNQSSMIEPNSPLTPAGVILNHPLLLPAATTAAAASNGSAIGIGGNTASTTATQKSSLNILQLHKQNVLLQRYNQEKSQLQQQQIQLAEQARQEAQQFQNASANQILPNEVTQVPTYPSSTPSNPLGNTIEPSQTLQQQQVQQNYQYPTRQPFSYHLPQSAETVYPQQPEVSQNQYQFYSQQHQQLQQQQQQYDYSSQHMYYKQQHPQSQEQHLQQQQYQSNSQQQQPLCSYSYMNQKEILQSQSNNEHQHIQESQVIGQNRMEVLQKPRCNVINENNNLIPSVSMSTAASESTMMDEEKFENTSRPTAATASTNATDSSHQFHSFNENQHQFQQQYEQQYTSTARQMFQVPNVTYNPKQQQQQQLHPPVKVTIKPKQTSEIAITHTQKRQTNMDTNTRSEGENNENNLNEVVDRSNLGSLESANVDDADEEEEDFGEQSSKRTAGNSSRMCSVSSSQQQLSKKKRIAKQSTNRSRSQADRDYSSVVATAAAAAQNGCASSVYSYASQCQLEFSASSAAAAAAQKKQINETKNIPKNYSKAIIGFIQKHPLECAKLLGEQYSFEEFEAFLTERKEKLTAIKDLRALWTTSNCEDLKHATFNRVFRIFSFKFFRENAVAYIYSSKKIKNTRALITYRFILQKALHEPDSFSFMKLQS